MSYKYWLPDKEGKRHDCTTEENAIIIVGANGSGKSRLGAWIEQNGMEKVHRIGAQRNLNFSENIQLKSYEDAENCVLYGGTEVNTHNKGQRWNYGKSYITQLIDDFDNVLAALIALKHNENDKFANECKKLKNDRSKWPDVPETSVDKLQKVWASVFSQRYLIEDDSKFLAKFVNDGQIDVQKTNYSATQMSDGERAVLYLAAGVLCVPKDKILIIDEPEIHLHRSIVNRLWKTLEKYRPDCLFIYITHDLDFAAAHSNVDKIWIKAYHGGERWDFERLQSEELPEQLLLEILGSRRDVLFVEGEKNSYDYQLYSQLYTKYLIIPCGSCSQVIARTKAFRASKMLHDCEVYGLIDRDYRSQQEIEAYKAHHIYVLNVAEVENLFLVEELIRLMAEQFGEDEDVIFNRVKNFVIDEKFANLINKQICQSVVAEIKYKLSCIEIDNKDEAEAKSSLDMGLSDIKYDDIKHEKQASFEKVLQDRDYKEVLKVFNEKGIAAAIGKELGIEKSMYQNKVINLMKGKMYDKIVTALKPYLPLEIPI